MDAGFPPATDRRSFGRRVQLTGQSESNFRAALKLADAMAPRALLADEIEKSLAGLRQARLRRRKSE